MTTSSSTTLNRRLARAVPTDMLEDPAFRATLSDKARTVEVSSSSESGGVSPAIEQRLAEAAASPQRVLSERDSDLVPHVEHRATAIERRRQQLAQQQKKPPVVKSRPPSIAIDRNSPHATAPDPATTSLLPKAVTWKVIAAGAVVLLLVVICARRWNMVKSLGVSYALAYELPLLTSLCALAAGVTSEQMRLAIRQFESGIHPTAVRYTPPTLLPAQLQAPSVPSSPPPAPTQAPQQPEQQQLRQPPTPPAQQPQPQQQQAPAAAEQVDPRKETILLLIEEATAYADEARDIAEEEKEAQQQQQQQQDEDNEEDEYEEEEETKKPAASARRRQRPVSDPPMRRRGAEIVRGAGAAAAAVKKAMTAPLAKPESVAAPPVVGVVDRSVEGGVEVDRSVEQQQDTSVESPSRAATAPPPSIPMIASRSSIPGVKRAAPKGEGSTIKL